MKKNEAVNFDRNYRHTICLDENLKFVKVLECLEQDGKYYIAILKASGERSNVSLTSTLIPLSGRLKNRDYDFVVAKFNSLVA